MNNHFSNRHHSASCLLSWLPVIECLCHLSCVTCFESPSGVDVLLIYLIHRAEIRNIWYPISSWHSSTRISSVISLMHAGSFVYSFWTPLVQYFMNWQETSFLVVLGLRVALLPRTSPHYCYLVNAIWSVQQKLSGMIPKVAALPAAPAVELF